MALVFYLIYFLFIFSCLFFFFFYPIRFTCVSLLVLSLIFLICVSFRSCINSPCLPSVVSALIVQVSLPCFVRSGSLVCQNCFSFLFLLPHEDTFCCPCLHQQPGLWVLLSLHPFSLCPFRVAFYVGIVFVTTACYFLFDLGTSCC